MNGTRPAHVFWDWNGTLLDDARVFVAAINRLLLARGLKPISVGTYRDLFVFPVVDYYRAIGFDIDHEDWDALAREFHAALREVDDSGLRPGAADALRAVGALGYGQSILSLCEQSILERKVRECGVEGFFARLQGVDNLDGASKVDVGRHLLAELSLPPGGAIVIGDTLHDVEVAAAIGCGCILVSCGHQSPGRLSRAGCPVAGTLAEAVKMLSAIDR